jgi:peptidyl-prolyl cis-trans isomerase D
VNRASSLLGGLAIIAIAVVFIVNFQPGGGQNQLKSGPDCAAEVMGRCVRTTHFWAGYRVLAPGADSNMAKQMRLRQVALDGMIERELLIAEGKRLGISVSEDELSRELVAGRLRASLPAAASQLLSYNLQLPNGVRYWRERFIDRKTQKFSPEQYKKAVTELTHLSEPEFREFQRGELIASRVRDLVRSRVHVGESEARSQFQREKGTAKVKFIELTPAFYADRVVDRSPEAVEAWAKKNTESVDKAFDSRKKEYATECRKARHILVRVDPSDEEAKTKAKAKIEALAKRIAEGEALADLAPAESDDVVSAREGGALGCVVRGQMVKPFEDALFALTKEGEVSGVVESPFGFHLVELEATLKGADSEKAGRLRIAQEMYLSDEAKRLANEGAQKLIAAMSGGTSMEDALKAYIDEVVRKPAATEPNDAKKPAKDAKKGPKKDAKKPAKADEKAKGDAKDADASEAADAPKDDVDGERSTLPVVETSLAFNPTGSPFEGALPTEDVAALAFSLKAPNEVLARPIAMQNSGFVVMQLFEKKDADDAQWAENREFYMSSLRMQKQQEALVAYMKRLRAAHRDEVKLSPDIASDPDQPAAPSASAPAGAPPAPEN